MASHVSKDRDARCVTAIRAAGASAAIRPLLAAFMGFGIAPLSQAADSLHETMRVNTVRIEVTWIETQTEMEKKRREYGGRVVMDTVIKTALEGFSVLGKRDGELVCLVFSPKPERWDDRINTTLGHELLHCLGFSHR